MKLPLRLLSCTPGWGSLARDHSVPLKLVTIPVWVVCGTSPQLVELDWPAMTKTSPTPTLRTVSNDDGELTAELLVGLVERKALPSGAALKDLVFEGRRDGEGWCVLSARRNERDCGYQNEGELQLHLGSPHGSFRGGHERKDTADRG
jgi:hypothetical protein